VIPQRLIAHNFLSYKHVELDFQGLQLACLFGENGAGKSALLEVIPYALFSKGRCRADGLVRHNETNHSVELIFLLDGERYNVRRVYSRKGGTTLNLWREVGNVFQNISGPTIADTQRQIVELLRLDYETFVHTSLFLQGDADRFTTSTPAGRKEVLANILSLSDLEAISARAKERLKEEQVHLATSQATILSFEERIQKLPEWEEEWGGKQSELILIETQLSLEEEVLAKLRGWKESASATQVRQDALRQRRDTLLQQQVKFAKRIEAATEALEVAKGLEQQIPELERALAEIAVAVQRKVQLDDEYRRLSDRRRRLEGQGATCTLCGQPLSKMHREKELKQLNTQERQIIREQKSIGTPTTGPTERQLREVHRLLGEASSHKATIETCEKDLEEVAQSLPGVESELAGIPKEVSTLVRKIEDDLVGWASRQKGTQHKHKETLSQVGMLEARIQDARNAKEELPKTKKLVTERRTRISNLEFLTEAFSTTGLQAYLIEEALPEIEREANLLLNKLSGGRIQVSLQTQRETQSGNLRETLDILVQDEEGIKAFNSFSGGEAFRISFAIRVALSKLLTQRAGANVGLLVVDEGFGTQDAAGRAALVEAISIIQNDFPMILCISHMEDVRDAFPTQVLVTKDKDGSRVQLVG